MVDKRIAEEQVHASILALFSKNDVDHAEIARLIVKICSTVEDDKETLAVLVDNGVEPRLDIRAYSGGQLDRVEVALKMAMADLGKATRGAVLGLQCFDEPTGGLDDSGKEALAALLFKRCAQDYPCTFVVSHDPRMASAFPRRLTVSKAKDGSTTLA